MRDYNTSRTDIVLKEYGRHVQKLGQEVLAEESIEKRTVMAEALVELMKQLNPNMSDGNPEHNHKAWDHLHIITDFALEVDGKYEKPSKESLERKPDRVKYPSEDIRYKHYGKNVEFMIQGIIDMENKEDQPDAILYLGNLMKRFYANWNKDNVDDEVIAKHIEQLSKGELKVDIEEVKAKKLFDQVLKTAGQPQNSPSASTHKKKRNYSNNNGGGGRSNQGRRRRQ